MKRIIVVFLLSFVLFACSSQEEIPESETARWVFQNGTAIELQDTWRIYPTGNVYEAIYIQDEYGLFYMSRDGRNHETVERIYFEDFEMTVEFEDSIRLFSMEITIEEDSEIFDGYTQIVQYIALVPNDTVFHIFLPINPDLEIRRETLIQFLSTAYPLHETQNVFGFVGGLANMVYSDDWEIVNSMGTYQPELQSDDYYVAVSARDESFWLKSLEDEIEPENIIDEDIINEIFFRLHNPG